MKEENIQRARELREEIAGIKERIMALPLCEHEEAERLFALHDAKCAELTELTAGPFLSWLRRNRA